MDQEAAILAAVAANPSDDLPRLAYADWLEEHAADRPDPEAARVRAEFIRVQCEIARLEHLPSPELQRYADLYRRQDALRTHHRRDLLGPLADAVLPEEVDFVRGFVAELAIPAAAFLAHAGTVAGLRPRPRVGVRETGLLLRQLVERSETECVTGLTIGLDADPFNLDPGHAAVLAACPYFSRLEALSLEGCLLLDSALDALVVGGPGNFPALSELDLSWNHISDEGVRLVVGSWLWTRLDRLVLGGNPVSDEGAEVLADAAGASRLEYLNLKFTGLTSAGHRLLLRKFPRRTKLDLF